MTKKNTNILRIFRMKVTLMLSGATTVINLLDKNRDAFAADCPQWIDDGWMAEFRSRIERMEEKLGIKANEQQRSATQIVNEIKELAIEDLKMIKATMEIGYAKNKTRLNELLGLLGFNMHWLKIKDNNMINLQELLFTFNNHTNDDLYAELEQKGVPAHRMNSVKEYAKRLNEANSTQELLKVSAPEITAEMTVELNDIYTIAISICKVAKIIFRKDKIKRAQFSFSRLTSIQSSAGKQNKTDDDQDDLPDEEDDDMDENNDDVDKKDDHPNHPPES